MTKQRLNPQTKPKTAPTVHEDPDHEQLRGNSSPRSPEKASSQRPFEFLHPLTSAGRDRPRQFDHIARCNAGCGWYRLGHEVLETFSNNLIKDMGRGYVPGMG